MNNIPEHFDNLSDELLLVIKESGSDTDRRKADDVLSRRRTNSDPIERIKMRSIGDFVDIVAVVKGSNVEDATKLLSSEVKALGAVPHIDLKPVDPRVESITLYIHPNAIRGCSFGNAVRNGTTLEVDLDA